MNYELLVCKTVRLDRFEREDYVGGDDIFALVESGSFWFDDGGGKTSVSPLEAVCFQKGRSYHREITEPCTLYLFRYRSDVPIFEGSKVTFSDTARIRSTLHLLHLSDKEGVENDFRMKKSLFGDLITQFLLENVRDTRSRSQQDAIVSAAVEYLQANFHKKLNLAELAKEHYLSYVQFARRFKSAMGATPQDYLIRLRLKKAKVLLEDTDLSIRSVAASCGFGSEYYFSNFFKKHNKLSPTEFRSMIKSRV